MFRTRLATTAVLFGSLLPVGLPACAETRPAAQTRPAVTTKPAGGGQHNFDKWEKAIAAFEAKDREHAPGKGGVLFLGSSTIVRWKTLDKDFPDHRVMNHGFGGSEIADSTHFAERIIFPYAPTVIVLRAGGNDIHAGKSPEQVFADYQAFVAKVHARLPRTQIVYVSLSPAPARWSEREDYKTLNTLIAKYVGERPYLKYVETYDIVLGPDGQARPELFVADKLHLSDEGYRLLVDRVRPALPK